MALDQQIHQLQRDMRDLARELAEVRQLLELRPARYAIGGGGEGDDSGVRAQTGVLAFGGISLRLGSRTLSTLLYHPPTQAWSAQMDMMGPPLSGMAAATASTDATAGNMALSLGGTKGGATPATNWNDRFFNETWSERLPVHAAGVATNRWDWVAVGIENTDYTYVFGGADTGISHTRTHRRYTYSSDGWIGRMSLPDDVARHTAFGLAGKVYSCGGDRLNIIQRTVYKFDPSHNTWSEVTSMSIGGDTTGYRESAAACAIDDYGYVFSGARSGNQDQWATKRYDPAGNSWSNKANIPVPARSDHGGAAFGGKAYVCGGIAGANNDTGGGDPLTDTDVYDPDTDSWSTGLYMPGAGRYAHGVAAI
jgi:hypothetical protein